ncbi:MAG: class I SAM-dependent methyltransferase [Clostridiaceae bacterium]
MQNAYWEGVWQAEDAAQCAAYLRGHMRAHPAFLDVFRQYGVTNVCDAACGFGAYGAMLTANGFSVSLFDIANSSVELAKTLFRQEGLSAERWRVCDICQIAYPDESFDAIVAHAVIDHLSTERAHTALGELLRIAKPGGLVYLSFDPLEQDDLLEPHDVLADGSFVYTEGERNGLLFHFYTEKEIRHLLEFFKIVYTNQTARGEREYIIQTRVKTGESESLNASDGTTL